jgi:hypothetical protein
MKKSISISLVLLMLAAIMRLSVATHFCGGEEVASKLTVSGSLAGCGMEQDENQAPSQGTSISNHCCYDVVTICGTDNDYTPSFHVFPASYQLSCQLSGMTALINDHSTPVIKSVYTNASPPGAIMSTAVDLACICVFRI